jgi:hypothetical protein
MKLRSVTLAGCAALAIAALASAQPPSVSQAPAQSTSPPLVTFKAAIVALSNPMVRQEFENGMVATARAHRYDAITSYDLVPKVTDVRDRNFIKTLTAQGVQAVLMVRPAAVGPKSSLDAVKKEVSPAVLADMREFAKEVSPSGGNDLIAVVHIAIYMIDTGKPELVSSGAVWLDEPVKDRAEGIARLQNLIAANIDAARPAIRKHYGLPPLDQ